MLQVYCIGLEEFVIEVNMENEGLLGSMFTLSSRLHRLNVVTFISYFIRDFNIYDGDELVENVTSKYKLCTFVSVPRLFCLVHVMRRSILKLNWKRTFPHVIVETSNLVILCRKVLAEIRDNKTSADYVYFFSFNQMIYVAFSLPWPSSFLKLCFTFLFSRGRKRNVLRNICCNCSTPFCGIKT